MVLNFKVTVFACLAVLGTSSAFAEMPKADRDHLTLASMEVREISRDALDQEVVATLYAKGLNVEGLPVEGIPTPDPIERAGKVISVAKDLVALGEDIYKLVIKGKPTNTLKYAPISVVPKENGEPVDVMSTENWKVPVKRSYEVLYKNLYGMHVVKFRYSVIFAYGGTYNGKGAYLTAVQIVPESVSTLFGYDFTATMKLGGIQNNGSRENQIAGATLLMEYTVSTIMKANSEVDSFFVSGLGELKKL